MRNLLGAALAAAVFVAAGEAGGAGTSQDPAAVAPGAVAMTGDGRVEMPLTASPGDGYRGVQLFIDEARTGCTNCHFNADVEGTGQSGNVGPVLSLIGDRNPVPRLRAILVNARAVFGPDTPMPAFYVPDEAGETLLGAQDIEDLVAYLHELQVNAR
ncbi:hypothetical protein LNKW23_09040 [Paralimibaculum aggregatum]|uniref:Cytochrome c domain-containing protein n=1 Tax=Paralimibaculum aggregatum TaxID=3036245 RepID=A0ABQ6LEC1_9RHOB|nr:c-type cytochrome [Limibaculum sp. NKW23]GMG81691.1 hypothetical protein LNKW23_09040 [Limibaculum sp. NKW23]